MFTSRLLRAILPRNNQRSPGVGLRFWVPGTPAEDLVQDAARIWALFDQLKALSINSSMIPMLQAVIPPNLQVLELRVPFDSLRMTWKRKWMSYWALNTWKGKRLKLVHMLLVTDARDSEIDEEGEEAVKMLQEKFRKFRDENADEWQGFPTWSFGYKRIVRN